MAKKKFNIKVDTINGLNKPEGTIKQLDSVFFNIEVTEEGEKKDLTGQTIKLFAKKSDGKMVEQSSGISITNAEQGELTIDLLNAAVQAPGYVYFELEISDSNGIISTADFVYKVMPKVGSDEAIESTNEVSTLKEIEVYIAQAKQEIKEFKVLQSEMLKTNETINVNEVARVEAENSRVAAESARVESDKQRDEKVGEFGKKVDKMADDYDKALANMTNGSESATNSEVVQARGSSTNLGARLDSIELIIDKKANTDAVFTMANMGQDIKEAMTGGSVAVVGENSIGRNNYKYSSIDESKLTFVKLGKNKFTGDFKKNYILRGDIDTGFVYMKDDEEKGGCCGICKIDPNKTYTVSKDGGNRLRVALFNDYPLNGIKSINGKEMDSSNNLTITAMESDNYMVIYTSYPSMTPPRWIQVEEGDKVTNYEPPKPIIDLDTDSLDPYTVKNNLVIGMVTGNPDSFVIDFKNKNILINNQGLFIMNGKNYYTPSARQTLDFATSLEQTILIIFNLKTRLFELCYLDDYKYKKDFCLVGTIRKDKNFIFINGVKSFAKHLELDYKKNEYHLDFEFKNYRNTIINYIEETVVNTSEKVYSEYDKLMNKYPDYITKTLLGTEATGLPIYCYDFNPKLPVSSPSSRELPILLYTNGIHGHEKNNQGELLRFFTDLCDNWKTNEALGVLRWNLRIKLVPIQNPWGLNNKSRNNSNNIDLNRNYTWKFESGGDHGPLALSEKESKIIDKFIKDNSSAILGIDHHNFDRLTTHTFYLSFYPEIYSEMYNTFLSYCNYINYDLKRNYSNFFLNENTNFSRIEREYLGGVQHTQFDLNGVPGTILETVPSIDTKNPQSAESKNATQKHLAEVIGNLMLSALKNNKHLYECKNKLI